MKRFVKTCWTLIRMLAASLGGVIGCFLGVGGYPGGDKVSDGFLTALVVFVAADFAAGVAAAAAEKRLSSAVGFRGIARKVLIFVLVGAANMLDVYVIRDTGMLRTATVFFYIANEGLSLLENAARLGLPLPGKLRAALAQLKDEGDGEEDGGEQDDGEQGANEPDPGVSGETKSVGEPDPGGSNSGEPDPGGSNEAPGKGEPGPGEPIDATSVSGPDTGNSGEDTPYGAASGRATGNPDGGSPDDSPRTGAAGRVAANGVSPDPSVSSPRSPVKGKGEVK